MAGRAARRRRRQYRRLTADLPRIRRRVRSAAAASLASKLNQTDDLVSLQTSRSTALA
jgi:hypothetical protein